MVMSFVTLAGDTAGDESRSPYVAGGKPSQTPISREPPLSIEAGHDPDEEAPRILTPTLLENVRAHLQLPDNAGGDAVVKSKSVDSIYSTPSTRRARMIEERRQTIRVGSQSAHMRSSRFQLLAAILQSHRFEVLVAVFIVGNCVTMGISAELLLGKVSRLAEFVLVVEHIFVVVFVLEIMLKVAVFGWRFYTPMVSWGGSWSNFFDMIIVFLTGVVAMWIFPAFGLSADFLQPVLVLRGFRLLRLVRVVHSIDYFHEMWLLIRGFLDSGRVLLWTSVVLFFITYAFATFGVVLIGVEVHEEFEEANASGSADDVKQQLSELMKYTNGIWPMMHTLVQVLTLDSWMSIARPLSEHSAWAYPFFYLYVAVAVIVMMNLVTAVIVENALSQAKRDADEVLAERDRQKRKELCKFMKLFESMDVDGNHQITMDEFECAFEDVELKNKLSLHGIQPENCRDMFELLDTGDGSISMQEFFEGLQKLDGPATAKDLFRNTKTNELLVKLLLQHNLELQEDLGEVIRNTPGAQLQPRLGSLRLRASRPDMPRSENVSRGASNQSNGSATSLESSTVDIRELVQACNNNIQVCNERVAAVAADLADLRSSLLRPTTHS